MLALNAHSKKVKGPDHPNGFLPAEKDFKILWLLDLNTPRARRCSRELFVCWLWQTDAHMCVCIESVIEKQIQMHPCSLQLSYLKRPGGIRLCFLLLGHLSVCFKSNISILLGCFTLHSQGGSHDLISGATGSHMYFTRGLCADALEEAPSCCVTGYT